jgi:hypothetical protein
MNKNNILKSGIILLSMIFIPGCFLKKWIGNKEVTKTNNPIVTSQKKNIIATESDLKTVISFMEKNDSGMKIIPLLSQQEQEKIYTKIVNDYIVSNYLIKRFINDKGINQSHEFKTHFEQYMKLMEGNFYALEFQKQLEKEIEISDADAQEYYEKNKEKKHEFLVPPFCKQTPGIEARALKMEQNKDIKTYESQLKSGKDVIKLERINKAIRGHSGRLADELSSMKDGETRAITLENGVTFAVYRVKNYVGEWNEYQGFKDQIKKIMKNSLLEKKYAETIEKLKIESGINIDESAIKKFISDQYNNNKKNEKTAELGAEIIENEIAKEEIEKNKK